MMFQKVFFVNQNGAMPPGHQTDGIEFECDKMFSYIVTKIYFSFLDWA